MGHDRRMEDTKVAIGENFITRDFLYQINATNKRNEPIPIGTCRPANLETFEFERSGTSVGEETEKPTRVSNNRYNIL